MNELQNYIASQTPIEISLGIDANGMITSKKLYEFLGMDPKNYSRWCKNNIIENQFAEENVDYWVFFLDEENPLGGRPTQNFKLTARFAKKLSMLQKNERGEEAREYFTRVEDYAVNATNRLKELQNNPLKLLEIHYQALRQNENEIAEVSEKVDAINKDLQDFKTDLPILGVDIDRITGAVHIRGVRAPAGERVQCL